MWACHSLCGVCHSLCGRVGGRGGRCWLGVYTGGATGTSAGTIIPTIIVMNDVQYLWAKSLHFHWFINMAKAGVKY